MSKRSGTKCHPLRKLKIFMLAEGEAVVDQLEEEQTLYETTIAYSSLSHQFIIVLSLAGLIATLGMMADSSVAIVGAMLIAPLMKPIMAIAYGLVTADSRLKIRALLTLAAGILITLAVSVLTEYFLGLHDSTVQILARTRPSLIDLGIAVAAGVAAALASIRRNVADTLPGVAIAVSLVPPLCAAGICLSNGAWLIGEGAILLFAINLVAIVLSAAIVFLLHGYGSIQRARNGMIVIILVCLVLSVPLATELRHLRIDDLAQEVVVDFIKEKYLLNEVVHPDDLSQLDVILKPDHIFVYIEIKSPIDVMTIGQAQEIQKRLEKTLESPVNLKMQLLVSKEYTVYPKRLEGGKLPLYGTEDLVPRR